MSPQGSVSRLLDGLKAGETAAAGALWEQYCDRLVRLARRKLRGASRRVADEEDVALSAFNSLCLGARDGRFPALLERHGLWGLLVFLTAQKAADRIAYEHRAKRGGGKARGHSALAENIDQLLAPSPGPATLNVWAESYERLLARLGDAVLRRVAELRVQGYTVEEIAERLGLARRTIHRKLDIIWTIWRTELPP
jgi:DNA-directed RNA polymerase specialized sigma24 family protein